MLKVWQSLDITEFCHIFASSNKTEQHNDYTMEKEELIQYLIEEGYSKEFAEKCGNSIVSEESFKEHIIDVFRSFYMRAMEQLEGVSEDLKQYISYSLLKSLTRFEIHLCYDPYSPFYVLEDSDLYQRAFAIFGGVCFVIFDDEQDALQNDENFHSIIDWSFFNKKAKNSIISSIKSFDREFFHPIECVRDANPYRAAIKWLTATDKTHENYDEVKRLLSQYHYGQEPKRELERLLDKMGILEKS